MPASAIRPDALTVDLSEVSDTDLAKVGGKACKLGELVRQGLPIPPGFVVTTAAFDAYLTSTPVGEVVRREIQAMDVGKSDVVEGASARIRQAFVETPFPPALEATLRSTYVEFARRHRVEYCAVRSSATAEDLADASFAGLQETYLNVAKPDDVLLNIRRCWGSLYTPRVMVYRQRKGFAHHDVKLAVLIQRMVNSTVSGIMFTADPNTGEKHTIIEAGWGLGELIVGGEVTPDHYVIEPVGPRIALKRISRQAIRLVREEGGGNKRVDIAADLQEAPKLSDAQILRLSSLGRLIESHYRRPMDIEWCMEGEDLYVVQARPVTTGMKVEGTKTSKGGPAPGAMVDAARPGGEPRHRGGQGTPGERGPGHGPAPTRGGPGHVDDHAGHGARHVTGRRHRHR
jgi:pyruvate, water dikinase